MPDNSFSHKNLLSGRELFYGTVLLVFAVLVASGAWPNLFGASRVGASYFGMRAMDYRGTEPSLYLMLFAYLFSIALIGERLFLSVLLPSWNGAAYPVRFFAGFVPGYVLLSALNRAITLILPNSIAPAIIGLTVIAVGATLFYRGFHSKKLTSWRSAGIAKTVSIWSFLLLLLSVLVVYYLQRQGAHITGDAFPFFDNIMKNRDLGIGSSGRLPVISQHYDELMVLYPVFYGLMSYLRGDTLVGIWMLNSFFAVGSLCMLYISARMMRLNTIESIIVTTLMFFGMFSLTFGYCIYPVYDQDYLLNLKTIKMFGKGYNSYLLFDSGNPLSQCMHPGRVLGVLMPIFSVAYFLERKNIPAVSNINGFLLATAFCAGVATTTISNTLVLAILGIYWLLNANFLNENLFSVSNTGSREKLLSALLYIYPFAAYSSTDAKRTFAPFLLLIIITLFVIYIFFELFPLGNSRIFYQQKLTLMKSYIYLMSGVLTGLVLGLLVFGNLLIIKVGGVFGDAGSIWGVPILTRPIYTAVSSSLINKFGFFKYSGSFPLYHTAGPARFLAHFGMLFLVVAAGLFLFQKTRKIPVTGISIDRDTTEIISSMILFMLVFLVGLFCYDFMGADIGATEWLAVWLRSRLLEPWYYALLFIVFVLQRRLFPGVVGTVFILLISVHCLKNMLIFPGIVFKQLLINARFIVENML